jgi:uncharacterized membrane protein YgdD (TMEM256/DUF423 family)
MAGVFGAVGVALGAFGAHGLAGVLADTTDGATRLGWWQTASQYHLVHAIAVALAGWRSGSDGRAAIVAGIAFGLGVLVFSGTLYAMALGAPRVFGAVTPIGGIAFIVGWIALALGAWRTKG